MKNKLLNILKEYSEQGKYGDEIYIFEIYKILQDEFNIDNVNSVKIEEGNNTFAIAEIMEKRILVYLEYIKEYLGNYIDFENEKLNIYFVNIYLIKVLIHEFMHFIQIDLFNKLKNSSDFLDKIFVNSFSSSSYCDTIEFNHYNSSSISSDVLCDIYVEHHDCFVFERLAEYKAFNIMFDVIDSIRSELREVYFFFENLFYYFRIKDYYYDGEDIISPLEIYLFKFDIYDKFLKQYKIYDDDFDKFLANFQNTYTLGDRLTYGLPISVSELNYYIDVCNVMNMASSRKGYELERVMK